MESDITGTGNRRIPFRKEIKLRSDILLHMRHHARSYHFVTRAYIPSEQATSQSEFRRYHLPNEM